MNIVKPGWVLDFGGGTGLDMEWLITGKYNIIFCEPSPGMRKKAMDHHKNIHQDNAVIFLDDAQADFTAWSDRIPFDQKTDAVLSNFAVLNCIQDIARLFKNLSLVLKPGGHMIALILNRKRTGRTMAMRIGRFIRSMISGGPVVMHVQYYQKQQTVYLHSEKEIRAASADWFDFYGSQSLSAFDFSIIHLIRK